MPTPVSVTDSISRDPSTAAETVTLPPRSVNLMALATRFSAICLNARGSPFITGKSSGARVIRSTPLSRAFSASKLQQLQQRRARRERLRRNFEIAGFHLGHVEDAVDDRQQMLAGIVDQLRIFLAARGVDHHRLFVHDHLGETDDGVQRRAQLVAHGGQESGLGGIRLLGGGARQFERLLLDLAVGDVAHHGDDLGLGVQRLLERPATHLDPDEIGGIVLAASRVAAETEFDAACSLPRAASDSAVR